MSVAAEHHCEHIIDNEVRTASVCAQINDKVLRVVGGGIVERVLEGLYNGDFERVEVEEIGVARAVERGAVIGSDAFKL